MGLLPPCGENRPKKRAHGHQTWSDTEGMQEPTVRRAMAAFQGKEGHCTALNWDVLLRWDGQGTWGVEASALAKIHIGLLGHPPPAGPRHPVPPSPPRPLGHPHSTPVMTKFCWPCCHSTVVVCPSAGKSAISCVLARSSANASPSVVTVNVEWANSSPSA